MHTLCRTAGRHLIAGLALALVACSPEKDGFTEVPIDDGNTPNFTNVSSALQADCGTCHSVSAGRTFTAAADSATLVTSGLLDPANPGASAILMKPRSTSHGGGVIAAFSTRDSALVAAWIATLPNVGASTLSAVKTEFAPTVDGLGEALWLQAKPLSVSIGGGWADARSVTVRAMYDDNYVYMLLRWTDDEASYRRQPWIKNADGTWTAQPAKPAPTAGMDWAAYMNARGGAAFNAEAAEFMYEDKVAFLWNTYAPTTHVPEFEQIGCAAACHDPANAGGPGTTYSSATGALPAKKYLTVQGQILDMWHWKLVRQNMSGKMEDQFVRYWAPANDATLGSGGRASDPGAAGYRGNPATNGRPTYKSRTQGLLPAIYSWSESDTLRMTDEEVAALPAGTLVGNMITSPLTGSKADVDAYGVHDRVAKTWTMEIRRRRLTDDSNDVQFDDLTRTYKFGVAVFDNAQIEHSYSGVPLNFVFKP